MSGIAFLAGILFQIYPTVVVHGIPMDSFEFLSSLLSSGPFRLSDAREWLAVNQSDATGETSIFTIEGMRGQEYSVGIFIFMLIGVLVFAAVILRFVWMARKESGLKTGEKILFIWIIFGTFVAVIFGGLQLLQGRLF